MNSLLFIYHSLVDKLFNKVSSYLLKIKNSHFFVVDMIIFFLTPLLALVLRLDGDIALTPYLFGLAVATILFLVVKLSIFASFGFYQRYWHYASIEELTYIGILMASAVLIQTVLFDISQYILHFPLSRLPQSLPFIDGLISCIAIGGLRFSVRAVRVGRKRGNQKPKKRVLIIGAGSAGVSLVQEMQRNPQLEFFPVAFIDDNPEKLNLQIRGIPVVGDRYKIPEVVNSLQIDKAIVAMPAVEEEVIQDIVKICTTTEVDTSTLPGIHEIINGRVLVDSIRDVRIEDLLRREPVQIDIHKVADFLRGKRVLITGAGGSIGSELCRQVCKCLPAEMILIGHGENSVFNIQQELGKLAEVMQNSGKVQGSTPQIHTFIADIRFRDRLQYAFDKYQPDVIFHAAAHKHVPLMEVNSPEAISNNVVGTKNLLDMALRYNVKHFVMISTDKAVNPTNIMGASKRVAEMLVLQAARVSGKPYVAVRFGNVLGSRGSVIPTFKKQIAAGGPITVTHPEICRYFMTIPEAVQLVLQAVVLGHGGEVLMLNMGKPIKIVDLAQELIRLCGYKVNKDIDIVFTGLRPGEKLFEELFIQGEEYQPTEHEKLLVVKNASRIIPDNLEKLVKALCQAAAKNDAGLISFLLKQIVPGYQPKSKYFDGLTAGETVRDNKTAASSKANELTRVTGNG